MIGYFGIHRAPYLEPALRKAAERLVGQIDFHYLFPGSGWHPYWGLDQTPNSDTLKCPGSRYPNRHDDHAIAKRCAQYDTLIVAGYAQRTLQRIILHALSKRKAIVLAADSVLGPMPWYTSAAKRLTLTPLGRKLSGVWVPGQAGRLYWAHYGVSDTRIFEGLYCLDVDAIRLATETARIGRVEQRRKLGLLAEDFVFLFVGRLVDQRGLKYLTEAFANLRKLGVHEAKLLIVGNGPWRERIEEACRERKIPGVQIIPPVPFAALPTIYTIADAYVQPSLYEPYSLSTMQAAISGLPIIATNVVGAVADCLKDGHNGHVVNPRDADGLSRAMHSLATKPGNAKTMGATGCALAMRRTPDWAASQLIAAVQRP
jgi:glycosyltransferase involved in cell wall biosynthesis